MFSTCRATTGLTSPLQEASPTARTIEEGPTLGMTKAKMTEITTDQDLTLDTDPKGIKITETALKVIEITEAVLKVIATEIDHKAGHKVMQTGRHPNQGYPMTREKVMTNTTAIEVLTEARTEMTEDDPSLEVDKDPLLATEITGETPRVTVEVDLRPGTDHPHLVQKKRSVTIVDQMST